MLKGILKTSSIALSAIMLFSGLQLDVQASGVSSVLPGAGINTALSQGTTLENIQNGNQNVSSNLETLVKASEIEKQIALAEKKTEEDIFENLVIAQAEDYIYIRSTPTPKGKVVGKFYRNAVGTILSKQDGWYEIQSGNVIGYVKAEYCVAGEEAIALSEEVGIKMACIECDRLLVRKEAGADGSILGMVAMGDELMVIEEADGWIKVDIEEGFGWVSAEYVKVYNEYTYAESKEEEKARLEKESVEKGKAVAEYAVQFVGNPYVWGGTSLTDGADCSGFVLKVYEEFGVELPHSSAADRKQGYAVVGLENAQPGDLICYSGHVALYIGDGMIVHAANSEDGIKISEADYRTILAIRRIF